MKEKIILVSLFLSLISVSVYSQKEKADTNFLLRENGYFYHAVFIDNQKSNFYNEIANNKGNPWDSAWYNEHLELLRQNKKLRKHPLPNIPKNWRPLYLYKGKYYVYAPSEWGTNAWVHINDSTFVEYIFVDGTQPSIINSIEKIKHNVFQFSLWGSGHKQRIIKIYIVDVKKQIAVFENTSIKGDDRFYLMVGADKIKNFPIIVNYCKEQKVDEFNFDKPDYKNILKDF